ncbi:hypothetical protein D3C81_1229070 [compost metagenome]
MYTQNAGQLACQAWRLKEIGRIVDEFMLDHQKAKESLKARYQPGLCEGRNIKFLQPSQKLLYILSRYGI